jgi:hypothetical protein
MKKTFIAAALTAGIMTLTPGTYAFAADMNPTMGSAVAKNNSDITVMPGTNDALRLHFSGAERLHIEFPGGLTVFEGNGERMHYKPDAWQMVNGKLKAVEVRFHIEGKDEVTVQFGKVDKNAPVILKRGALMFPSPLM